MRLGEEIGVEVYVLVLELRDPYEARVGPESVDRCCAQCRGVAVGAADAFEEHFTRARLVLDGESRWWRHQCLEVVEGE